MILSVSDDSVLDLNILWATFHLHMYTIIVDISITFRLLPSVHLAFFRALIQLKKVLPARSIMLILNLTYLFLQTIYLMRLRKSIPSKFSIFSLTSSNTRRRALGEGASPGFALTRIASSASSRLY